MTDVTNDQAAAVASKAAWTLPRIIFREAVPPYKKLQKAERSEAMLGEALPR